jgi:signal transduction histidine kinase
VPNPETENIDELRVLVMAPFGRDAQLIVDLLKRGGFAAFVCPSVEDLISSMLENAGAAIVAEEALTADNIVRLTACLQQQSTWSDFPLVVLTTSGEVTPFSQHRRLLRSPLQNVQLLERPVRPETMLSTVANALRARRRQYQIRDQMEQYELAAEALRKAEKLAVAGRLAASIAHEINNPLESVTNLVYLLRSTPLNDEGKRYVQLAEQELARVSAMATQTLKFYRDTAKPGLVDIRELLESVLALYGPRLSAAEIRVMREFDTSRGVVAKAGELRQLFANLVGNAIDAMRAGGTLRLRVRQAATGAFPHHVRVSVADTGTGIPRELRSKVFEPFISTKGDTGTGLGLWVSKEIIENHGGAIRLRSSTSPHRHGTTFSVYLPVARVKAAA